MCSVFAADSMGPYLTFGAGAQGTPALRPIVWVYVIEIFVVGSKNARILKQSAKWPFKIIQGH